MKFLSSRTLILAALIIAPAAQAQSFVTGGGARGQVTQSLTTGGVSLLSSFDLDFGFGNDHQITRVKVLPNDASTSVSVAYNDKNSDDAYNYKAGFWGALPTDAYPYKKTGSCRGRCSLPLTVPQGYVFVLRGFSLQYASSDHHIKTIGIDHAGTNLNVYYSDNNGDDLFYYEISYALVRASILKNIGEASGSGVNSASATLATGRQVLRGFLLNFAGDHHISKIRVAPEFSNLSVFFRDKNGDDSFSWRVKTASLL
jgi:hypothetical protein